MDIVQIFPPYFYGIRYGDGEAPDEYHRLLFLWQDIDYLLDFFEKHAPAMNIDFWGSLIDPELAAERTIDEAFDLEEHIEELCKILLTGENPISTSSLNR